MDDRHDITGPVHFTQENQHESTNTYKLIVIVPAYPGRPIRGEKLVQLAMNPVFFLINWPLGGMMDQEVMHASFALAVPDTVVIARNMRGLRFFQSLPLNPTQSALSA